MEGHRQGFQQDIVSAEIGQALGHPIRLEILRLLAQGERCSCQIEPLFRVDQSGVSRHLAALRRAGLIVSRQDGVRALHRLASPRVARLVRELNALADERTGAARRALGRGSLRKIGGGKT